MLFGPAGTVAGIVITGLIALGPIITNHLGDIVDFIKGYDWNGLFQNLLDFLTGFIKKIDWYSFFKGIMDFLGGINWGDLLTGLCETVMVLLGNVLGATVIFFDMIGEAIGNLISNGIEAAKQYLGDKIEECGGNVVAGILKGITDAVVGIGEWIYKHLFKPFIEGFASAFGIHSPSTVMAEQGGYIIDGLLKGLKDKIGDVLEWIAKIPGWVKDKLGDAKEWLKEKGQDAIEGLKNGWESVKNSKLLDKVKKLPEEVHMSIGDIKEKLKSKGSDIISGLRSGFDDKWSGFREKIGGLGDKIKNALPNLYNIGKDAIQGFANGFYSLKLKLPHISISWNKHSIGDLTFSTPSFGLNWYAKGGLAYSPSVVGIGEAGNEAILPLENKRTMGMIAESIMAKAPAVGMDEEILTNAVARGMAMAMMNNIGNLSGNSPKYIQNSISLDGDVLLRAVTKAQDDRDFRYNMA